MNLWTLTEYADLFKVRLPDSIWLSTLGIKTSRELREWVDKDAEKMSDISFPEGYVVYWAGKPVAKMKNSKYLTAFHVSGGNKGHAKNSIILAVFNGSLDDVYSMMIPELQQFADKIKERVAGMGKEIIEGGREIGREEYATQKDYALAIQSKIHNKQLHAFFFSHKLEVLSGANLNEIYTQWIKDNYKRFLDLWKEKEIGISTE